MNTQLNLLEALRHAHATIENNGMDADFLDVHIEAAIAAERSATDDILESMEIVKAVAHIGIDWGYGKFELTQEHIDTARRLYEKNESVAERSKEQAKPQQEPVGTVKSWTNGSYHRNYWIEWHGELKEGDKLYTSPQPLKPLSDEVLSFLMGEGELEGALFGEKHPTRKGNYWWRNVIRERAIEAKLGVGK